MKTLGIVGGGNIGQAIAKLALASGFEVTIINSRDPETLAALAASLGSACRAGTIAEAAQADLVVVAIPFFRYGDLPSHLFDGKTVIDTMNFDPSRDSAVADAVGPDTAPGVLFQSHIPGAHVIKAFSNIFASHIGLLSRPAGAPDRSALPIAGDSVDAKQQVTVFLDRLGWDAVDAGPMRASLSFDLGKPAFVAPYMRSSEGNWGEHLATDQGGSLSSEKLIKLLQDGVS